MRLENTALARKQQFQHFWALHYPELPPINDVFKQRFSDRWVRIHSLPDSKRYADTKSEWDILLQRQNAVIDHVLQQDEKIQIVINAAEEHNYMFTAFNAHAIGVFKDADHETEFSSFVIDETWQSHTFNPMLIMIAEEQMRAFIIGTDCIVAPYDGGMDIIAKDTEACWAFKRHFSNWLSKRHDGL
jgi:hypothetical protein